MNLFQFDLFNNINSFFMAHVAVSTEKSAANTHFA